MSVDRVKDNLKMLDSIDFIPYLRKHDGNGSVSDVMRDMEDDYERTDFVKNDVMEGYLFNWVNSSELCDYLTERYGNHFRWYEVTREIVIWEDDA